VTRGEVEGGEGEGEGEDNTHDTVGRERQGGHDRLSYCNDDVAGILSALLAGTPESLAGRVLKGTERSGESTAIRDCTNLAPPSQLLPLSGNQL
jgi:hypothetical protein